MVETYIYLACYLSIYYDVTKRLYCHCIDERLHINILANTFPTYIGTHR